MTGTDEGMLKALARRRLPTSEPGLRARLKRLATGDHPTLPAGSRALYEPPGANDVGICCSGGGIRSAAFNLGALQRLQERPAPDEDGILQRSKYLSAVSGGSYIAAAFCMVAKTWDPEHLPDGPPKDSDEADDSDPRLVTDDSPPFEPGSPEEQYLRNHLSYLAPTGLARVYLGLRMLAGMLVNIVIVGLPVFLIGLFGGLAVHLLYGGLDSDFHVPFGIWLLVALVGVASLGLSVVGVVVRIRQDSQRRFVELWQVRLFLIACAAAVALIGVPWIARTAFVEGGVSIDDAAVPGVTALGSMAALAAAAIAQVRGFVKDQEKAVKAATRRLGKFAQPVREALVSLVVLLVGPLLLVMVCALGVLVGSTGSAVVALAIVGSGLLLAWVIACVDLTSVSLHPFYRRRLASAFALKRVKDAHGEPLACERSFDRIVELSKSGIEPGPCDIKSWPMLIVCAAANISDPGVTPPGRGVASFTFSPMAIGGPVTGAACTAVYENLRRTRARDVTLPAAVAMSGAALSPAMGKLTYRPLMFLLGLANIRLGVWVPNPMHIVEAFGHEEHANLCADEDARKRLQPPVVAFPRRPRPHYLFKEMLGRNRLDDKFLYVTDGGHYENLGLVELLRRGCRTIYCFDAGGGFTAGALVDAIALARTELNVEIIMDDVTGDELEAKAPADDANGPRRAKTGCATGTIIFPSGENGEPVVGTLIYTRSVVTDDAPWPVRAFQTIDPVFPHHSTMDQFFDDQKFEAYRLLGTYAADRAVKLAEARRAIEEAAANNGGESAPAGTGTA